MLSGVQNGTFDDRVHFREMWEISQHYRVWEANEKLKLYPSLFIEPQLRCGKSEIFEQFEQDMNQGNLNDDTIAAAVHNYINKLQKLSELNCHGIFFTRNEQVLTYFLTARATWEKNSYYYRQLVVERQSLGGGAAAAMKWGDWRKAQLPITEEYVYGVLPAYSWNRLFLFWLELRKETETDSNNNVTERYFLQPQFCRQNLDSSFTDPWSPTVAEDVNLEVTDIVNDVGLSSYEPVIYQPFYDSYSENIILYFDRDTQDAKDSGNEKETLEWRLVGNSSRSEVQLREVEFQGVASLPDYRGVPSSLRNTMFIHVWDTTFFTGTIELYDEYQNRFVLNNYKIFVDRVDIEGRKLSDV